MVIAREETPCRSGRVKLDLVGSAVPVRSTTTGREHDAVSTALAGSVAWRTNSTARGPSHFRTGRR